MCRFFSEEVSVGPSAFLNVPLFLVSLGVGSALAADATVGIPVKSDLVKSACGACHEQDDAGMMSRISYERKSPEAWELTLKRMMRTGGVQPTPSRRKDHPLPGRRPRSRARRARAVLYRAEKRPTLGRRERRGGRTATMSSRRMVRSGERRRMAAPEGCTWLFSYHRYQTPRGRPGGRGGRRPRAVGGRPTAGPPDEGGASTGFDWPRTTTGSTPRSGRNIAPKS
jgi:hypothetical protein